jgi:hypothetical protein
MQVKAPTAETFASSSSLFGETALALQDEHGFAAATAYDESRVVLFGGASTVAIEKAGGLLLPDFLPQTCTGPDKCTMTLSNFVNVVSPVSGSFVPSTLPYSGAGGVAAVVRAPDGSRRILVRPGFVQKPPARVELGTAAWLCALDDADAVTCETVAGTDVARGLSTGVCLAEEGGVCRDYMILGGGASGAKGDAFAEIYLAADGTLRKVGGGTGLPTALAGAVAVRLAGTVFTFGGVTDGEAAAGPLRIDVDASTNKVSASAVGSRGADVGETLRLFHQATPLADGSSVLLTGGIGKDKKPLDTAILLTAANGTLTVKAKLKLAKTDGTPDPRVGHAATLVTSGLLKGAILVTGGLSQMDTTVRFAAGAQIFVP